VIADLHTHYPMYLMPGGGGTVVDLLGSAHGRWRLLDHSRAALVRFASRLANYRSFQSGPRVTIPLLRSGGVGIALSILYSPCLTIATA
jgi:hypothetical protein